MNAKEETEPEVPRVGNSLIETADDVILISDDDDDVENESVIIISSDSDDCAEDIEFVKVIEQNQRGVPAVKVEKSFSPDLYSVKSHVNLELSSPSTEKGFFILSTDDLPDIPILNSQPISPEAISKCADSDEDVLINYFNENLPFQDKNRKRSFESDQPISPEAISKCADSDKDVLINYFNENLPFQDKNRTSSSESDDWRVRSPIRPLLKKQKLEYKDVPSKILHGDNKKKIAQNLLLGQLNRNLRNSCTKDIDCCYFTHRQEGTASPTGAQLKCLLETMLTDDSLQYFALRTMCKAVNRKQYLSKKVCNMLLEHIYGCEEKMEAPVLQHLYLGISILNKQLFLHPTCRDNMRKYYLEICETWWPVLMRSASALITDDISPHPLPVTSIEPEVSSDESFQPVKVLNDFSDISSKKEAMKHKFFQNLTRAEKIHRITIILNYFTSVMQSNVMVWLIKYRYHKKTAAFRKDVSPIIAEITWKNDVLNFGSVNFYLKQLFQLFARTSKEQSLHRVFSVMIHIHAVVLHRKEKSSFPEMGSLIQGFAHQLFLEIKATPNVEENVNSIHPHWLRFLIGSYLLGVEEPANFFKAKERIHQLLKTKDKGQYLLCPFDVEKLCLYVLESMCNMMGFQSETDYLPSIEKIVEDESVWFFEMLTDDFLEKMLEKLEVLCHFLL